MYAQNYFEKVQEAMSADDPQDFEVFHTILTSFDPEKETVPELYFVSDD